MPLPPSSLLERIVDRIRAEGPLRFDDYLDLALYDPEGGFYATTGGAGRARDFITSPEVGPLFGAVLARALDTWWQAAGRPGEWTVIDAGAGPGTLLQAVLGAEPACAGAMRPIAVDRSADVRNRHAEGIEHRTDLPDGPLEGVIVANELLDNVPWRLLERTGSGWSEVWVGAGADRGLIEVVEPATEASAARAEELAPGAAPGARLPLQEGATAWLVDALDRVERGRVVVVDYGSTTADLAARAPGEWLRTYRDHERGGAPLDAPGSQDITVEVATDQLAGVCSTAEDRTQSEFLRAHGIDDLVAEGKLVWSERAHLGDLLAIKARSRVGEGEALVDPAGLGAFRVLEWPR